MRIPVGNFGNTVAPLAPQAPRLPLAAFGMGGEGLIEAGANLSRIASEELRREEAERKLAEKTEAQLLWVEHENNALQTLDETREKLARGELSRDEALRHYRETVDKAGRETLGRIAQDLQGPSKVKFDGLAARGERAMQQAVAQHQRAEIAGNLEAIRDGMLKQASLPGADIGRLNAEFDEVVRALGPQAGLDPAKLGKLAQGFKDAATFTGFKQRVIEAQGSVKNLQALEAQIKVDPGLDSDKRLALLSSTQGQINVLIQRAAIEAERRDRANEKAWDATVSIVQAGKPLSADYAADLAKRFKGTAFEKPLAEMVAQAPQNLAFAAQPVGAQSRLLDELQAKGNREGWRPSEQKQYEQLDKVHRATLADIRADPWKAGLERGVLRDVVPLNTGDLQNLPAALAARRQQADTLAVWAGREVSLLRPEEARQLGDALDRLNAPARAGMLAGLGRAMSPGQMQALSAQLGSGHKGLAVASLLASRDMQTDRGRSVAEIYLRGQDALAEKRVSFDESAQAKVRANIFQKINGAYASDAATRDAVDAVFTVYVGIKSEGNAGDVDQAIRLATGGIMELNGGRIAKPFGWSDSQVRDAVRRVTPEQAHRLYGEEVLVGGERMSAADFALALPRARLGPSPLADSYSVIVGGRQVATLDGRPLLLPLELR
jgi:hypothetical protein